MNEHRNFLHAHNARGLVTRWQNGNVVLSPPLIFTRDTVDETIAGFDAAFAATPL